MQKIDFAQFKKVFQTHVNQLFKNHTTLFTTKVDKDELWNRYLESYPKGTNEIFRKKREHDCSCCRQFIRAFGNVVVLNPDLTMTSIWDFKTQDDVYQVVIDALATFVKQAPIENVFVTKLNTFGTDRNRESLEDGKVRTWDHFYMMLPKQFVTTSSESEEALMGKYRDATQVFQRSLAEISLDATETILDLIAQNSLYKGEEWKNVLSQFHELQVKYHKLRDDQKNVYCWLNATNQSGALSKIKNHSIGTLLIDITKGTDLDVAVKKYEKIVAPTNYKRPKAIFTQKMIQEAEQMIAEMDLTNSLERRFAVLSDISINNVLFADRNVVKKLNQNAFSLLEQDLTVNPKSFSRVEEIPIEQFVTQVIPKIQSMEVLVEGVHVPNFVSLIAPLNNDAKSLFKWGNPFSWAYSGNIADSIKENVKKAGGNVDGVIRFSLQWNENGDNQNDLDAHCYEANDNHIWFSNKGTIHRSSGKLDVDIIYPDVHQVAVENIIHTQYDKIPSGIMRYAVHNFTDRGGRSGFSAEIEFNGQLYSFVYPHLVRNREYIEVAKVQFDKNGGFKIIESLPATSASRKMWNIQTNQFQPVSVVMFSPNYWDNQREIGHKHYFFMLKDCLNEETPNGFYNEFLREEFMQQKRVFEALGAKMKVMKSDNQLSGLGFSSTKRASLIVKVDGHFKRTLKIVF